jgi:NADH dehydrogenase/NADH:ubiquinone oxidoreductase subunit G
MNDTDTSRFAHIRFPALAWGEKDGTVTNSERRISRQRAFCPRPERQSRTGGSSRRWRNGWATATPLPGSIRTRFLRACGADGL